MSTEYQSPNTGQIEHLADMKKLPVRIGQDPEMIKQGHEVLMDNNGVLVTKTAISEGMSNLGLEALQYNPAMASGLLFNALISGYNEQVTIHDSRTGLPDYEVTYKDGLLGKKIKKIAVWEYPTIPDEEKKEETIYGIKKTTVDLSRRTYRKTIVASELPRQGGLPEDGIVIAKRRDHYDGFSEIDKIADAVVTQIRKLPDFKDIKDPRKHRRK